MDRSVQQFDLGQALRQAVVCQKRTGRHKQFVFIIGNKVYKGSFKQERIDRIRYVSQKCIEWKTPFVIHPDPETYRAPEGLFISYPNLAEGYHNEERTTGVKRRYEMQCIQHTESWSGLTYNVLTRSGLVKLGDVLTTLSWIDPYIPWLTLSLCHLFILEVGDVGLYNILADVNKERVYIIDYDEQRTQIRGDDLFYFSKRPAKDKSNFWSQRARPYYNTIADQLATLSPLHSDSPNYVAVSLTDPKMIGRTNIAIRLLRSFATTQVGEQISEQVGEQVGEQVIESTVDELTTQMANLNLGKMSYKGPFGGSTTYSGYTIDIMKSALQKYIRRNIPMKAEIAAFELYRMASFQGGKSIQTNMYNRLAIISVEDIGPANLPLVITVVNNVLEGNRDPATLGAIVQLMAMSVKTRIPSHFYYAYIIPKGREIAKRLGLQVDDRSNTRINHEQLKSVHINWLPQDPIEIKPYAEMFYLRLAEKNPLAVTWLGYYMIVTKVVSFDESKPKKIKVGTRRRRQDPMTVIWDILGQFLPIIVKDTLERAYFKMTEQRPFLMCAVVSALYRDRITQPFTPMDISNAINQWRISPVLNELLTGQYHSFEVDDFVIDKHTGEGRRRGASRKQFTDVGAIVIPKSDLFHSDTGRSSCWSGLRPGSDLLEQIYKTTA